MEDLKELISCFSTEEIGPKMLDEKSPEVRDEYKGKLLAHNDMLTVLKVYEEKDLGKMKEYLDRMDPYAENLNLYINVYEPRAEAVIASKIKALQLLKTNLLAYIEMQPAKKDEPKGISGDATGKNKTKKTEEEKGAESEVPKE